MRRPEQEAPDGATPNDAGEVEAGDVEVEAGDVEVEAGDVLAALARQADRLSGNARAALARQADTLSENARAVLRAGAVIDPPFTIREVAAVWGGPSQALPPAVDEAVRSGQLIQSDHGFAFRDAVTREAVYHSLSTPVRQALHRQAAAAAEAEGRDMDEVIGHLSRGGAESTRQARQLLMSAIRAETSRSPGTAAQLAARLLDLTEDLDEATASLLTDTLRGLIGARQTDKARALGDRAIRRLGPSSADGIALRALVEVCRRFGAQDAVVAHTRGWLKRRHLPAATRAELFAEQAYALVSSAALVEAEQPGSEALALGAEANCHTAISLGANTCSAIAWVRGELSKAHELARKAVRASAAVGPHACRYPRLRLAHVLAAMDRFDEAHEELTRCERAADIGDAGWVRDRVRLHRAELLLSAGLLQAAGAEVEAGLAADEQDPSLRFRLLAALAEVAVRQGRLDRARQALEHAAALADRVPHHFRGHLTYRAALLYEAGRGRGSAAAIFPGAGLRAEQPPDLGFLLTGHPNAASTMVRHALRDRAVDHARRVVAAIRDLASANPEVTSLAAAAEHASGLLTADRAALDRAVELFRRSPRPLGRASALEDAAMAAIDAGELDRARSLLGEAEDIYSVLRVTLDAERVRGLADRHATRHVDWSDLTESEMRVVRLIVEGKTNREVASSLYLSPHTVDSHLRHSFAKLNVRTRVDLARLFFTCGGQDYPVNA